MTTLLVVEDNVQMRMMIAACLKRAGYGVVDASNGLEALDVLEKTMVSAMVVDVMMPGMDGLALIDELRLSGHTLPILIVTAKEELEDKRSAFKKGADDYLVKPVDMEELLLRIEALLRRSKIVNERYLTVGKMRLNQESLTTIREDEVTVLPLKEFLLLQKLLSYPGRIFTRQILMDEIWGYDTETDPRTVDVHIKRLREKYWDCEDFEIKTVRGLGYKCEVRA